MVKRNYDLRDAAQRVKGRWTRYGGAYGGTDKVCLVGALSESTGASRISYPYRKFENSKEREVIEQVIQEQYPNESKWCNGPVGWNDSIAESEDDVIMVLEKAAAKLEELERP